MISSDPKEDRRLKVTAMTFLVLVAALTMLRACTIFRVECRWRGPFGTVDYTRDPGVIRHLAGLWERD